MDSEHWDLSHTAHTADSWHTKHVLGEVKRFSRHFIEDILRDDRYEPLNLSWREKEERKQEEDESVQKKKQRTTFSGWQIFELERVFEARKYINCAERRHISR